jgi:hypothetical protein
MEARVLIRMLQLNRILPSQFSAPCRKQASKQELAIAAPINRLETYRFAIGGGGRKLVHQLTQWLLAGGETVSVASDASGGSAPDVRSGALPRSPSRTHYLLVAGTKFVTTLS